MIGQPKNEIDWARVRELCCLTGKGGEAIDRERWPAFAESWIAPYQKHWPEFAFLFTGETAQPVLGYLTGCPSSAEYRRLRCPHRRPEAAFSTALHARLEREFPAHLHVNLLKEARGQGAGGALMRAFEERLLAERKPAPGIHVFCGIGPVGFYERYGYQLLERVWFNGVEVFCLGKSILL